MLADKEVSDLVNSIILLAKFHQILQELSASQLRDDQPPLYNPENQVLMKTLPFLSPSLEPVWKGPHMVILATHTAVQLLEFDSWIHRSGVKLRFPSEQDNTEPELSSEAEKVLKLIFKERTPQNEDK